MKDDKKNEGAKALKEVKLAFKEYGFAAGINTLLGLFGARVVRKKWYDEVVSKANKLRGYEFHELIDQQFSSEYFENLSDSKSQIHQDLFVLSELGFKKNGFFVEFGATDGIDLSNSHLLETKFDWSGILAEPAKIWHSALHENRSASIETECVWKETGETLIFNEVSDDTHG